MIIDDKHRFVFIHIPKCAGTSVRLVLQKYDSCGGAFSLHKGHHPQLGRIDMGHLPLAILRKYFPQEYRKVQTYFSVAVLRDPFARFPSSLYQRLTMYGEKSIKEISRRELKTALDNTIDFLANNTNTDFLPYDYIHFQKQHTYVFDQGERQVHRLYTFQTLETMFDDIGALVSNSLDLHQLPHAGRARVFKSGISRAVATLIKPMYTPKVQEIMPAVAKVFIKQLFYNSPESKFGDLFNSSTVRDFIETYYAQDVALYKSVLAGNG